MAFWSKLKSKPASLPKLMGEKPMKLWCSIVLSYYAVIAILERLFVKLKHPRDVKI